MVHFTDYRTPAGTYSGWRGGGFAHCGPGDTVIEVPTPEPRLIPGDPDASLIIRVLEERRDRCGMFYGRMPAIPRPRLPQEQIQTIRTWIAEGALDN